MGTVNYWDEATQSWVKAQAPKMEFEVTDLVHVSAEEPTDPNAMIWIDTDEDNAEAYYTKEEIDERFATQAAMDALTAWYGLGESASCNDLNNATKSGFYYGSVNSPANTWTRVITVDYIDSATQIGFPTPLTNLKNTMAIRTLDNGEGEWEWVNPPMELGVEYRTTERYLGKPVYAKVVNIGALADGSQKAVSANISNAARVVSCVCTAGPDAGGEWRTSPFDYSSGSTIVKLHCAPGYFENGSVTVFVRYEGRTGENCYALLKYTKTTD